MESDKHKETRKPNPREKSNPLSVLTFFWTLGTFIKGYKKDLEVSDLTETLRTHQSERLGNKLAAVWEKEELKAQQKKGKPSLLWALTKCFGPEIFVYGLALAFVEIGIRLRQPQLLGMLIRYFNQPSIHEIKNGDNNAHNQT